LIGETSKLWKVEVYAYCLMANHYLCGAPHNHCYVKFGVM